MSDEIPDSPPVLFPPACPGCEDYDPRLHNAKYCAACQPGTSDGADDDRARGGGPTMGSSDTDPTNQRAAGALWGAGATVRNPSARGAR